MIKRLRNTYLQISFQYVCESISSPYDLLQLVHTLAHIGVLLRMVLDVVRVKQITKQSDR